MAKTHCDMVGNVRHTLRAGARRGCVLAALLMVTLLGCGGDDDVQPSSWNLVWSDEFNGAAGTGLDRTQWLYDIGTGYPNGQPNWGTGEIEVMTDSTDNVYHDGMGHLAIKPIRGAGTLDWTSGRVETQRTNFQPPPGGALAIEGSLQQPNVSGDAALGYWPAFWTLGAPFRGNYFNWPGIGEIDIMEDVNGRSSVFGTLHCGTTTPPNPCNEFTGLSSGEVPCPGCQTGFHTYRIEWDESVTPQEIRWYLDGMQYHTVQSDDVDETTWTNATGHGYFIILNVAIGGGFPMAFGGGPTEATVPGIPMLVDYVRVYERR